jgi:plasmid replication initiation protein
VADHTKKTRASNLKTLRPHKHYELDFFIADEMEISTFRDELASMEHPFFALKGGDTRDREYKNKNVTITIKPTSSGMATIFDKDVWIYIISKLQEAINNHQPISRTVCFTPYDYFVTTNREIGGRTYKELEKALDRLRGTSITTNIQHSPEKEESRGFGLIDSWRIVGEKKGKLDIGMVEVTLPNWLYNAVTNTKVLKISADYFRIRKAIDRRLYEIARKHCGKQAEWIISLELLHLKTGSTAGKAEFKRSIKNLSKINDLPDYQIRYDADKDSVVFTNRYQDTPEAQASKKKETGKREIFKVKKKLGIQ